MSSRLLSNLYFCAKRCPDLKSVKLHLPAKCSVLLFSEDLEEIFELCDRVAVIFDGEFMGILDSDDDRLCDIGLMMAGSKEMKILAKDQSL